MNGATYQTVSKKLEQYKVGRGKWNLEVTKETVQELKYLIIHLRQCLQSNKTLFLKKDDTFVKFGNFSDIKKIISSRLFYPTFITGLLETVKRSRLNSVCPTWTRTHPCVNITIETDEDDLIGGFRLVNGATVWHNGPVIEALT